MSGPRRRVWVSLSVLLALSTCVSLCSAACQGSPQPVTLVPSSSGLNSQGQLRLVYLGTQQYTSTQFSFKGGNSWCNNQTLHWTYVNVDQSATGFCQQLWTGIFQFPEALNACGFELNDTLYAEGWAQFTGTVLITTVQPAGTVGGQPVTKRVTASTTLTIRYPTNVPASSSTLRIFEDCWTEPFPPYLIPSFSGLLDTGELRVTMAAADQFLAVNFTFDNANNDLCGSDGSGGAWVRKKVECEFHWVYTMPLTTSLGQCGWVRTEENLAFQQYETTLLVRTVEAIPSINGLELTKTVITAVNLVLRVPVFAEANSENSLVFGGPRASMRVFERPVVMLLPYDVDFRVLRQEYNSEDNTALVYIYTTVQYPYRLTDPIVSSSPSESFVVNAVVDTSQPTENCGVPPTGNATGCGQYWVVHVTPVEGQCTLNTNLDMDFEVHCALGVTPGVCTDAGAAADVITISMLSSSDSICQFPTSLQVFSDPFFTIPTTAMTFGDRVYLKASLQPTASIGLEGTQLTRVQTAAASTRILVKNGLATPVATACGFNSLDTLQNTQFDFLLDSNCFIFDTKKSEQNALVTCDITVSYHFLSEVESAGYHPITHSPHQRTMTLTLPAHPTPQITSSSHWLSSLVARPSHSLPLISRDGAHTHTGASIGRITTMSTTHEVLGTSTRLVSVQNIVITTDDSRPGATLFGVSAGAFVAGGVAAAVLICVVMCVMFLARWSRKHKKEVSALSLQAKLKDGRRDGPKHSPSSGSDLVRVGEGVVYRYDSRDERKYDDNEEKHSEAADDRAFSELAEPHEHEQHDVEQPEAEEEVSYSTDAPGGRDFRGDHPTVDDFLARSAKLQGSMNRLAVMGAAVPGEPPTPDNELASLSISHASHRELLSPRTRGVLISESVPEQDEEVQPAHTPQTLSIKKPARGEPEPGEDGGAPSSPRKPRPLSRQNSKGASSMRNAGFGGPPSPTKPQRRSSYSSAASPSVSKDGRKNASRKK